VAAPKQKAARLRIRRPLQHHCKEKAARLEIEAASTTSKSINGKTKAAELRI